MKGQSSLEFLILFSATMSLAAILSSAMIVQNETARSKLAEFESISKAESAARSIEAMENSGFDMRLDFQDEGIFLRIENSRFYVDHGAKVIEIGGIFHVVDDKDEPM